MKNLMFILLLITSPVLAQCEWNGDGNLDILDIVASVDCILNGCWDGSQCDWNADESLDILDIVAMVDCVLSGCWGTVEIFGCTDPAAVNYNPEATIDDGSCEYADCIDFDGNIYNTVVIGDQEWMAENLKTTHYRNGDPIPTGFTNSEWTDLDDTETGAYAVYDNDPSNADTYGNLYNWYAVDDDRDVCPEGWHVPTDEEWMELEMTLGMSYEDAHDTGYRGTDQGSQLAGNADLWNSGNLVNNVEFGASDFLALPGGCRYYDGNFNYLGSIGYFWSSTADESSTAWYRFLQYSYSEVYRTAYYQRGGFSVRCLGDEENVVNGCTDPGACNFNPDATDDDGSCWYAEAYYDCDGTCLNDADGDGVCDELEVYGCTDSTALNYNPEATEDDGSCIYDDACIDIDGNIYSTVVIGDQEWMAENLKVVHYRNGDPIPTGYGAYDWAHLSTGAYGSYGPVATYGYLYNWFAVNDSRNIAPVGWHVPTDEEVQQLVDFLGGNSAAGGPLKEAGLSHWNWPNFGASNSSGFTALPAGRVDGGNGLTSFLGGGAYFWSTTAHDDYYAWGRLLTAESTIVHRQDESLQRNGYSVRCVRD